ncbi:MAG: GDP-fucose synthetase [Candidatus Margulisbacteria bacterium GWF2_35_9]|nr:MAG: GDP-fucose synthetase [Candidatus Margulisbacteria bacterium GWF2_35_9]
MQKSSKIYIAGHNGLVGSAVVRHLYKEGFKNLIYKTSKELDLRNQSAVETFFKENRPDYVFLVAGKVGGIQANSTYPAEFIYDNMMIVFNVIHYSYIYKVKKLLFVGSSCIYPKFAKQPIKEEYLLSGDLEETNEAYAMAKISGIKMCKAYNLQYQTNFISAMPTNLFGRNDNYHPENSHVLPALIRRFHEAKISKAKEVVIWGTGNPLREFLFSDDLAEGLVFLMNNYDENDHINIGSNREISIRHLSEIVAEVVGYKGKLVNDLSKPDGTPRKLMDSSKIFSLGWKPRTSLKEGLKIAYEDFLVNKKLIFL